LSRPILFLLLWSAGFAIAKIGLLHAGPFTLLALRYLIAVLVLCAADPDPEAGPAQRPRRAGTSRSPAF
jgi:drug/metabolite transporter (DMT)-like permease